MKLRLTITAIFIVFATWTFKAQTYLMNNNNPVTDCSGTFYDGGGPTGNYAINQNLTKTFCSDGMGGTHVQLNFSGAELGSGDVLCFYDGATTSAPLLACSDDYPPGEPFIVQATAVNPSGCLTVTFVSDGAGTGAGWAAAIKCIASCQTVLSDLVSTNPAIVPSDTGWIDVCPGERIFFKGKGVYPQNGFAYPQSDFSTSFEWNFGDGDLSYGPNTSHKFENPGGYYVQLVLTDTLNCRSTNLINLRVRVAPKPRFNLGGALAPSICAGDTVRLGAAVANDGSALLLVTPDTTSFAIEGSRSDSLALPDGTGIPYKTSIYFTEFSPGQVITGAADIESICVNMEHSWMRDMRIKLTCPSGDTIGLHNFGGTVGGQVFLGEPNDFDTGLNPIPGVGYDYCWTATATNGTWLEYANTQLGGSGTLPPGDYSPYDPFSDLIGCPLNGEWSITATDLWPIDNGFMFSWSIKLAESLYPDIETFSPALVDWSWNNHPSIFYQTQDSIAAAPQNAGTAGYTFKVTDEFGCVWDTLITVSVLPVSHPDCHTCVDNFNILIDTAACLGEPVLLDASSLEPAVEEVRFEAFPDYRLGFSNHPHANPFKSPVSVSSLGYTFLTNPTTQITSICMDVESDFDFDLNIYLRSPDGKLLELTSGNGLSGDNYKITCFTPSATNPITAGTAPFNGTYRPEGNWASLTGAVMDGNWELLVSDGGGLSQFGKVKWWSIGFNFTNTINYTWTNGASLTCNDCPSPIATPVAPTSYVVTATDLFNCIHKDTVFVNVASVFPAPANLDVVSVGINSLTWAWDPVQGSAGYEVQIDGGPWIPANGTLSHIVNGLTIDQLVWIRVRAISNNPNCPPDISSDVHVYVLCVLDAVLNSVSNVRCQGDSTGSAFISVSNALPPVSFNPNLNLEPFPNGDIVNVFPLGNHFVYVTDVTGCRDTVYFDITEPPALMLNASVTNVDCNGQATGTGISNASGGSGLFTYAWQNCLGGLVQNAQNPVNLMAGCYAVTATDGNACTITTTMTVSEPLPFAFTSVQDSVSCAGQSNGSATINVTGATAPYTYLWANGQTAATATGLNAGFHTVEVTDNKNCKATTLVEVLSPAPLLIDSINIKALACFGGNNGTATAFAVGGTAPYTYQWSNSQTTQKATMLTSGNYTVVVMDAQGCTITGSVNVTAPPMLDLTFSAIQSEKCAGDCKGTATIVPTGGTEPYSYDWDASGTMTMATAINLCPSVYMVTVEDANGCTTTDKVTIVAAAPIDIKFNETPPACQGFQNGSLTSIITGGTAPYQYAWTNGATLANLQNLPCGSIVLTLTDAVGCVTKDTALLDCPELIQIQSVAPQQVRCFGESNGSITINAFGGSGTLTYKWSDPNVQTGKTATNLPTGNYTVTITDINGCSTTASGTITQPDLLTASVAPQPVVCFGEMNGTATSNVMGGTGPYTYAWNNGANTDIASGLAVNTYTVTVTDSRTCVTTATTTITQPATPLTLSISQVKKACYGENNGEAKVLPSGNNGGPFGYTWSNNSTNSNATGLAPNTYTVTVSDSKGCTETATLAVSQLDSIAINVAFQLPTCFGTKNAQATVNEITGGAGLGDPSQYTFQWSAPNNPTGIAISGIGGAQTYTVTATDQQGCKGSFDFYIPQPLAVEVEASSNNISCYGFADGTASVVGVQNAQNPLVYRWSNGLTSSVINQLNIGNYIITVTDAKLCTATASVAITEPEVLAVKFDLKALVCAGDKNASIQSNITGGTPAYQLIWSNGANTANLLDLSPGNYALSIVDQNGCKLTDSLVVIDPPRLVIQSTATDPSCFGDRDGRIKLQVDGGKKPYRYSMNGGVFGGSSTFIALEKGMYAFEVKDANGCITAHSDSLAQPLAIEASVFASDTTLILGNSAVLLTNVTNSNGILSYTWRSTLVDQFECADTINCAGILIHPGLTNTYSVVITDENGCTAKASIQIKIEKPRGVYVPTGFSPNGDQTNDLLVVHGKGKQIKSIRRFEVYDRWGELVYRDLDFAVNDVARGWDGQFRNAACDPGVYIWLVEVEYIDGVIDLEKGSVTLVK